MKTTVLETSAASRNDASSVLHCPKCGGEMIEGTCVKCKYSKKTAYRSRREAKEFTFAGD